MSSTTQGPSPQGAEPRHTKTYRFRSLLQSDGWVSPAFVTVNERGIIGKIFNDGAHREGEVEIVDGYALPGFPNAHSHAFQYAMAGMAEKHADGAVDDFWSWREAMYACALALDPDQMQAIATMLYAEMLKRGYTHVAEFQYLHHDKDGRPYDRAAEMSVSLVAAAAVAGIRITLIPVFYQKGDFGKEATPAQRRFCFRDVDQYLRLVEDCGLIVKNISTARLGFGVHSLRAANGADIIRIIHDGPAGLPFHMHVAEQLKEVDDAVSFLGQRPAEWLLNNVDPGDRFHFIHCTHLTDDEVSRLAQSKAHVVLCPGTEANLGDGIFRLADFARQGGRWSIGTDSQISLDPLEDLRWLDYAQRLITHRRNTFADGASTLVHSAIFSGRRAMGLSSADYFEEGMPFDAIVYDGDSPLLNTVMHEHLLPALVYAADSAHVAGTIVNGEWIVKEGHHKHEHSIRTKFEEAMAGIGRETGFR